MSFIELFNIDCNPFLSLSSSISFQTSYFPASEEGHCFHYYYKTNSTGEYKREIFKSGEKPFKAKNQYANFVGLKQMNVVTKTNKECYIGLP